MSESLSEIRFYHLTSTPFERAVPQLLSKIISQKKRVLLLVSDKKKAQEVDSLLWSYDPASFLPHGMLGDDYSENQPVLIATEPEAINNAEVVMITTGAVLEKIEDYKICVDIFNGHDEQEVSDARQRWKIYQQRDDVALTYWKQNIDGAWAKAA